jgi:hypothetical protein
MKTLQFILLSILASSCAKEQLNDCFTSLGDAATVSRTVDSFHKINSNDRIEVTLIQDSARSGEVEIEAPKNLIPQIKTSVNDGLLRLENTNTCNFVRSYDYQIIVRVFFNQIDEITAESASTYTAIDTLFLEKLNFYNNALSSSTLTLDADEIFVQGKNSSETLLSGKTRVLKGTIEEVSNLDASNLQADEALLDTHTPYDCYIQAIQGIYVNIYNSGNIYYSQEPSDYKLTGVVRGSGKLLKK